MFRKTITLAFVLCCFTAVVNAQEYRTGLGIRGGMFSGITFKRFVNPQDAFEITLAIHHRNPFIAGMYQMHANAFDVRGMNWYYGPGAHIGFYQGRDRSAWFDDTASNYTVLGVNGVVGLEYKIDEIPVSLSADITPALNIAGHFGLWIGAGFSIRYVF